LQPYFIRTPGVDLSGVATTPSTVEVYVNGQLMNRIAVQPGTFTLRDVPVTGGLGNTQLVVRDAFGRQTVQQASFYLSTTALRKGLSDYVFSAGYIRNDLTRSFDYDRPAVLAQYRRGLTNSVTLGGRGEAADGLASGGPRATISSRVGDLDLNFGASRADQLSGTASSIAYRFQALHFSFGTAWIHRSDHYATLSLRPSDDRVTRDLNGFISVGVGPVTVGVVGSQSDTRAGQQSRQVALQTTVPLSRWGSVFASLGRIERNGDSEPAVIIGMTISVGRLTTANIGYQKSGKTAGVQMAVRRPLSLENGYGYEIERDSITDRQFASLQYQSSFGRYRVDVDPQNAEDFSYGISGGLVRIGDRFLFSRPVQDSFALARVGVPNVMVYSSNQPVGRTNRFGDLLVPHLLPYYANPLSISDKDVPMDYEVEATQVIAVPPARGGIIAQFPVRRLRTFTGAMRLMIVGVPYVPSLGQVDVTVPGDQALVLSLGRGGEFYAEDLQPGTYPARLRIGKVHCDFELTIPPSEASQTDLGVIPCTP
jgi:outer membrane usher protein